MTGRPRILFVCARDAGLARMSAAYLDHLAGDRYEALSAGPDPAEHPHREVVAAMAEEGIEIADAPGTLLTAALAGSAERIIGMGGGVDPAWPALTVPLEDWGVPGPEGRPMPEVRVIRDTLRRLVERLVARLDTEAAVR